MNLIPDIDKKKTITAAKEALEKYQLYILREPEIREPQVIPAWANLGIPHPNTNAFHSSTEDCAISNVDRETEMHRHVLSVRRAVSKLNFEEQRLIILRYLKQENMTDVAAYLELGMSERNYYRLRNKAFYKIAFALRIEVYREDTCEVG